MLELNASAMKHLGRHLVYHYYCAQPEVHQGDYYNVQTRKSKPFSLWLIPSAQTSRLADTSRNIIRMQISGLSFNGRLKEPQQTTTNKQKITGTTEPVFKNRFRFFLYVRYVILLFILVIPMYTETTYFTLLYVEIQ